MSATDREEPLKPTLSDLLLSALPPPAAATTTSAAAAIVSPPEANDSSEKKKNKKRKAEEGEGCRTCSCKKSRCLKLYCICFASGVHCSESCGCDPCYNKAIYGTPLKVIQTSEASQDSREQHIKSLDISKRKCTCKKSGCFKKYCDCYQGHAGCSINCKCDDCRNPFGRRVGLIMDGRDHFMAPIERNGADSDSSDNDEDDYIRPLSPMPPSPISRESSFQHETLVGIEVHTVNGHPYSKPLSQMQPEPWQLVRRSTEEVRVEPLQCWRSPSKDRTPDVTEGYTHPRFLRDDMHPLNCEYPYSISRCIEVMNTMVDLSQIEKSLAADVFLEPSNREIFLSLSVDVRTIWLRRKIDNMVQG